MTVSPLVGASIEVLNPDLERGRIRFALFDFDGTLSLIREGWQQVMIPMMVEILLSLRTAETREELATLVADFVDRLTGEQTIYQMIQLCEEVRKRGAEPLSALEYKQMYLARLSERIRGRVEALKGGRVARERVMVPGAFPMLEGMQRRQVTCYLASGTDEPYVLDEAAALGIAPYFAGIYGALDDYRARTKRAVIEHLIEDHHLSGSEFAAFGDGFVEIEDAKAVGGIAIGVASDEVRRSGINPRKRRRLIQAGADVIIPDFAEHRALLSYLFVEDPHALPHL